MKELETWLHEATAWLLPLVLFSLVVLVATTLVALGGFLREALGRRAVLRRDQKQRAAWQDPALSRATRWQAFVLHPHGPGLLAALVSRALAGKLRGDDGELQALAAAVDTLASAAVTRSNLVARAAPTLGLMATLIPMGPALLSLADNDVAALARSLAVAFGATVLGLLVGLLRSLMGSVRRQWYAADLSAFDAFAEALAAAPVAEVAA